MGQRKNPDAGQIPMKNTVPEVSDLSFSAQRQGEFIQIVTSFMTDILIVVDSQEKIQEANHATLNLLGYELEDLKGQNFKKILAVEETLSLRLLSILSRNIQRKHDQGKGEFLKFLDEAPIGILITSDRGQIEYSNPRALDIFEHENEGLENQPIYTFISTNSKTSVDQTRTQEFLTKTPRLANQNLQGIKKDGRLFSIEMGLLPLRMDENFYTVALVRDPHNSESWDMIRRTQFGKLLTKEDTIIKVEHALLTKENNIVPVLLSGMALYETIRGRKSLKFRGAIFVAKDTHEQKRAEKLEILRTRQLDTSKTTDIMLHDIGNIITGLTAKSSKLHKDLEGLLQISSAIQKRVDQEEFKGLNDATDFLSKIANALHQIVTSNIKCNSEKIRDGIAKIIKIIKNHKPLE